MTLKVVSIENVRNLFKLRTSLHHHLNIITGINGSGKTSFLESIFLLSCARSFRTREIATLISHGKQELTICAHTFDDEVVALRKSLVSPTIMRFNDVPCKAASQLARHLPSQVFYQDIFQIIDAGPSIRRSLLDWGLFHVKQNYFDIWKDYRRALKQRNTLLHHKANILNFAPWNKMLSQLADEIDVMRQNYIIDLNERFQQVLSMLSDIKCQLDYYKGWDRSCEQKSLETVLAESLSGDLQYQYTRYGAHQAELIFSSDGRKLKHNLSRGQQKIVLFALKIAQAQLVNRSCIFLMDDLFAELDSNHIMRLINCIMETKGQFFVTCHENSLLEQSYAHHTFNQFEMSYQGQAKG